MDLVSLINIVKYSKSLYLIYYYLGSLCVNLLKLFLKPDDKLIVFNSFGGRKFDDSPKAIYDAILKDCRFDDYKLVWAFVSPEKFSIKRGEKIRTDSFLYYKLVLKARVWVTNTTMTRALSFSGINTLSINTWHGSAIKKLGRDVPIEGSTFNSKNETSVDFFLAQSQYDRGIFSRAFNIPTSKIKVIGLPRNDELALDNKDRIKYVKEKLMIPKGKKIILYAPTFRDYINKKSVVNTSDFPLNIPIWKKELGDKYVLLLRAHHATINLITEFQDDDFVKNVSSYPNLNDLMLVSDMLISDYSSIFFDYSILHKPMICYTYDYDVYANDRGMYFDIRDWLPSTPDENELLGLIRNIDLDIKRVQKFQENFVTEYGSASQKILDIIYDSI